jgi:hypothetical protein
MISGCPHPVDIGVVEIKNRIERREARQQA